MNRIFVATLLAVFAIASWHTAHAQDTKTIKDPAEYQAYTSAANQQAPAQKAAALMDFVKQYPSSVVKDVALETAMGAFQLAGNIQGMQDAAVALLQINPNNLRPLALLAYTERTQAEQALAQNQQPKALDLLGKASGYGQQGLKALQATPTGDPNTDKLKAAVTPIFNAAIGMNALQTKNYPDAQKYLRTAVEAEGTTAQLGDTYPLATAYLAGQPPAAPGGQPVQSPTVIQGLWFAARAVDLAAANPAAQQQINNFGLYYYKKYHGSDMGWQELLAQAKTMPLPPADFTVTPAPPPPSPADLAKQTLASNDVKDLAFSDWLFILGSGYSDGANQVWDYVKGKRTEIQGNVVSATPAEVQIATTDDDKMAQKADVTVAMKTPFKTPPAPGTPVDYDATFDTYTPQPLMLMMSDGALHGAAATPAPARRPPVRKRPASAQ